MSAHRCHVPGCTKTVPPSFLMCLNHWRHVPMPLRRAVWRHYRKGQEKDKQPSFEYLAAAKAAIESLRGP